MVEGSKMEGEGEEWREGEKKREEEKIGGKEERERE